MRREFLEELASTLYIHRPLPLHRERSLEGKFPDKKVLASRQLFGESRREGCCGLAGEAGMKSMGETRSVALMGSTQPQRAGAGLSGLSQQGPPMCTSPAQATSGKPMTNPPTD